MNSLSEGINAFPEAIHSPTEGINGLPEAINCL